MIAVIQCQGSKRPDAATLRTASGLPVHFVADPELAPEKNNLVYARPDDLSEGGPTWRQILQDYNCLSGNPLNLYPAVQIYRNAVYERLFRRVGMQNLYILSAGWGLIRADFLTPAYDITFSSSAGGSKRFVRRRKQDSYQDFNMLPVGTTEDVLFFGSREYVPLFCALTNSIKARRTVFYVSAQAPDAPGCVLRRFSDAKRNTNWQFDCANAYLDDAIDLD